MQHDLVTVRPTHPLAEVAVIMWEAKIGCIPVTQNDKTLVGIITEADFILDLPTTSGLDPRASIS
jgi:acetoin utilization protein AcuB